MADQIKGAESVQLVDGSSTSGNLAKVNADGSQIVAPKPSTTGTKTNVASSASSVTLLALNTARQGATIFNDSTQVLYVDMTGGTASATSYTTQVQPLGLLVVGNDDVIYTGLITGIWAAANGTARVTEFT